MQSFPIDLSTGWLLKPGFDHGFLGISSSFAGIFQLPTFDELAKSLKIIFRDEYMIKENLMQRSILLPCSIIEPSFFKAK
jgi:hypothetical protein